MNKATRDKKQVKSEKNEVEGLRNQLARALADYDNLRKRTEAEKQLWLKFAKQELLIRILPVLDTLEVAQSHLKDKGLELAIVQFQNIFKEEGIEQIAEKGRFDEKIHEAVDLVDGGEKDTVAQVLQKGYKFKDPAVGGAGGEVIRPAKVRVFKGSDEDKKKEGVSE
ncbi:nucleotide exchange factor GrpE [Candidatus Woesebacteria bacterium GWB1_43_5]|uniref:Protein GrpE n=1 Tax=Candidatus Woesebacteria bacterium GWB1_43_5 TaxID=1802474 RepID=A0A1F7WS15_9BACT|nr:MAG: nucleotide exchange factor GrpE [Candidatus Woesebacteria bacterium GWB1_43_5]